MTTTAIETAKGTALAKFSNEVKTIATRCERARQRFNERIARAEADYLDEIRRIAAAIHPDAAAAPQPTNGGEAGADA